MKNDNMKIEQRLQNMKSFYLKTAELIDNLPDAIPEKTRSMLKDIVLGDQKLKTLVDGIDSHRPPRFFLIGRTGVGKSSLINAICGAYVAKVSDTRSCTETAQTYQCKDGDRVLMEILDTRGIAESETLNDKESAEDMLIRQINEFSQDVTIFMLNCTHRDDVDADVEFLKRVAKNYFAVNKVELPIVAVINKCDEMQPTRHKDPQKYPPHKIENINDTLKYYKNIIVQHGLKIENIIAVSSLIDWQTEDGTEVDAKAIEQLTKYDQNHLEMAFDGRYQIGELLEILEEAILDFEAQMGLRMAARLKDVVHRFAEHLNHIFSGISATIALTPIPVSDIYILLVLQALLVSLIASLSGRELSLEAAREFIFSMGGVGTFGFGFRLIAQQAVKFANGIWPGVGSAVSSVIAATGTLAIGETAIAYYIEDKNLDEVIGMFAEAKNKFEKKQRGNS